VWVDAATQVFYSYSLSNGIMVTMGSYNTYHHNLYRYEVVMMRMYVNYVYLLKNYRSKRQSISSYKTFMIINAFVYGVIDCRTKCIFIPGEM